MPASIYENVKKAIQDIVAPELKTIQGQIETLRAEAKGRAAELRAEIRRLDEKIDGNSKRLEEKIEGIKEQFNLAIDIHERLAALEAKIGH